MMEECSKNLGHVWFVGVSFISMQLRMKKTCNGPTFIVSRIVMLARPHADVVMTLYVG